MNKQLSGVRWKRVTLATAVGVALVLAATTAYDAWRRRDGWCVEYAPDGSERVVMGLSAVRLSKISVKSS